MREIPFTSPDSVDGVVEALIESTEARLIAGGTDLLIQLQKGVKPPPLFVSLHRVDELRTIVLDDGVLRLGSGVSLATLAHDETVRRGSPLLSKAAASMASPPVRSRGTIGGNLCNASPAADLAPPLLVHEAEVVLQGPAGTRTIALSTFLKGPGMTALAEGEVMTEVVVPMLPMGMVVGHKKHQVGVCGNLSIISIAVGLAVDEGTCKEARIALGAVAPTAARYPEVEDKLVGKTLDEAAIASAAALGGRSCSPIDDVRASCDHRCHLVEVLLPLVINEALADKG